MGNRYKFISGFVIIASILGLFILMFHKPETNPFDSNNFKTNAIVAEAQIQSSTQNKVKVDGEYIRVDEEYSNLLNKKIKNNNVIISNQPTDTKDIELENIPAEIDERASISKESTQDKNQSKSESVTVKTLRKFYDYAASDVLYTKAYEMLDENFTLRLDLLKKIGLEEVKKSDLDLDSFPMYSSLFKTTHIKKIVKESTAKGNSTIYYYQSYTLGDKEQVSQVLAATFKKVNNNWLITSIR